MTEEDNNRVEEPLATYSQPINFEKVWLMFQETDKQFQESKKLLDEKFRETDRKIDRLSEITSGLGINLGEVAEDFFREALENMDELADIQYSHVDSLKRATKKLQGQYDIVLFNEETIVVIEVKQKLHPKDVEDFHQRKLPNFKKLFPEYKERKLIGAVAGLTVPHAAKELAVRLGYLVLTQGAHKIKVLNKKGFVPVWQ